MGYRNDVAIALRLEDFHLLRDRLKSAGFEGSNDQAVFQCDELFIHEQKWAVIVYYQVRWDTDFTDVAIIMDFLAKLKEYQFLRIGDEPGDDEYEDKASGWNLIEPEYQARLNILF